MKKALTILKNIMTHVAVAFLAFILGVGLSASIPPTDKKPTPVPTVSQDAGACNEKTYKDQLAILKEIDAEGFGYCSQFGQAVGEAIHAASEGDTEVVTKKTQEIQDLNTKIETWSKARQEFLEKTK